MLPLCTQQQLPTDKATRTQWWYPFVKMGCGATAAVTAMAVCYPLDTLRRRMQMNGAFGQPRRYSGLLDCVKQARASAAANSTLRSRASDSFCISTLRLAELLLASSTRASHWYCACQRPLVTAAPL